MAAAPVVAATDAEAATATLAEAVLACVFAGRQEAGLAAADRALELAHDHPSPDAEFFASMAQGIARVAIGEGEAGAVAVRRAVSILESSGELPDDPRKLVWIAFGPLWLREAEAGRALIGRLLAHARSKAAIGVLPTLLTNLGRDQATTHRWPAAEASYDEALRLARETGQRMEVVAALAGFACLEGRQGREAACRDHAAEASRLSDELGLELFAVWTDQALADLELGLGRPAAAVPHLEAQADRLRASGIGDVDVSPAPELVDAQLRLGHRDAAVAIAAAFAPEAEAKGQPWALARATRAQAMVADAGAAEPLFEAALELHAQTPDVFETARTRFAYGAYLRRARRRVRARDELRAALDAFERLGAAGWADQAEAELAATGETARRRDASTLDQLTPQELQIAHLLAAGRTTREAAAAIFLSPKTVEYHLRNVYRKLGINSRDELAAHFAPGD
jgi:DNA-binding CsgD family transcriptional regulator